MSVDDLISASTGYILLFGPIFLVIAVISTADLILHFTIKLFRKLPDYGFNRRRGP